MARKQKYNMEDFYWTHKTNRFTVAFRVEPETMDPADSFQFDEGIESVRSGSVEWFIAIVEVYGTDNELLGSDYLGGCAYKTIREFISQHRDRDAMNRNSSIMRAARGQNTVICHYFPDMVKQAIADARLTIAKRSDSYSGIKH